jgi:dipeptidyl aminopeptidase/acylaminoacyl peptidase
VGKQSTVTNTIVDQGGHVGIAHDNGGPATWGNLTARDRMTKTYNYLQTRPNVKPGKVFLMFGSMGGLISLNWAAANPTKVAGIIGVIPVINPNDIQANNRWNYGPEIHAAYGGTYVESVQGSTSNPRTMANTTKYSGIPMLFFYGLTDDLCLPGETEAFATAANSNGANVTLVGINDGHTFTTYDTVATPTNRQLILNFLATYS